MLQVRRLNNGTEEVIDLSKRCHEVMADENIRRMLGNGGIMRELRQECDFFCGEFMLVEYMSRELGENETEIYMSDELSGERFFIIFNDKNMARYLKLTASGTAGSIEKTYNRIVYYFDQYNDDDGFGCDELMFMALVTIYELNCCGRELPNEEFFVMFKGLKAMIEKREGYTDLGTGHSGEESLRSIRYYIESGMELG